MVRLDPLSLNLFICVVEEGTIAAAAEREHLVPAAVSKRISELELQLKTPLLVRTNKGVEATESGEALVALARRALTELELIPLQLAGYASGVQGLVRICASTSAVAQFLPADIKAFLDQYPDVEILLEEYASSRVTKAIVNNAADIGVFTSSPQAGDLDVLPYDQDRLVVCAPRTHVLATRDQIWFSEVLDEEFVGMHHGSAIDLLLTASAGMHQKTLKMKVQVGSFDSLCLMISCGLGIGVLPQELARRGGLVHDLHAVTLNDDWAVRDFWICRRASAPQTVAARLLAEHLQKSAATRRQNNR